MSYIDPHHSPHALHKQHFDYPQHHLSPHQGHAHQSPHSSPHLGHHHASSSRSYPTLEMPSYPESHHGASSQGVDHSVDPHVSDVSHLVQGSPLISHHGGGSRVGSPTPGSNGAYYDSRGADPHYRHDTPVHHSHLSSSHHRTMTPEPRTPDLSHHQPQQQHVITTPRLTAAPYGPTLKVIQWTPQHGDEGSQVTIILDSLAIRGAAPTQYSIASFGPGSPTMASATTPITRRFSVVFGGAAAPTKFRRAQAIDGNGVGQSMSAGPDEQDAFVVLTTFVPARQSMGPVGERIMVLVQVVDESSALLEECIVGEWDAMPVHPVTPPRLGALKRAGEDLDGGRDAPGLRSPATHSHHGSPVRHEYLSPQIPHQLPASPQPGRKRGRGPRSATPLDDDSTSTAHHTPRIGGIAPGQPDLLRTSQIPAGDPAAPVATFSNKAILKLQGDLNQMAMGWSNEEWTNRRRLIQFWRQQESNVINATFRPIAQNEFVPNSIVISCIFRDDWNECFVTSVDTIYLLEALVGVRFTVEEKNRIRRNLEGFKPMTVSKSKADSEPFFKLIMGFPNPKPRNIEKDVKVFPWKILASALKKIISKYSATYTGPAQSDDQPEVQISEPLDDPSYGGLTTPILPSNSGIPPRSPLLASPHIQQGMHSPHLGGHSPRIPQQPQYAASNPTRSPPPPGTVHSSPVIRHTAPNSPHISQHAPPPPHPRGGHGRPGSFDFNAILDSSAFSSTNDGRDRQQQLFPSAEDYGVSGAGHERLLPPGTLMAHSRSYSEGPRPSYNAGASSGGYAGEGGAGQVGYYAPEPWAEEQGGNEEDEEEDARRQWGREGDGRAQSEGYER